MENVFGANGSFNNGDFYVLTVNNNVESKYYDEEKDECGWKITSSFEFNGNTWITKGSISVDKNGVKIKSNYLKIYNTSTKEVYVDTCNAKEFLDKVIEKTGVSDDSKLYFDRFLEGETGEEVEDVKVLYDGINEYLDTFGGVSVYKLFKEVNDKVCEYLNISKVA